MTGTLLESSAASSTVVRPRFRLDARILRSGSIASALSATRLRSCCRSVTSRRLNAFMQPSPTDRATVMPAAKCDSHQRKHPVASELDTQSRQAGMGRPLAVTRLPRSDKEFVNDENLLGQRVARTG